MKPIDNVMRAVKVPYYDDKPKKRYRYKYPAKIGTGCGCFIWCDKPELNVGDTCFFADEEDFDLGDRTKVVAYPSMTQVRFGIVSDMNSERVFISL